MKDEQKHIHDDISDEEIRIVGTNLQFNSETIDSVLKENSIENENANALDSQPENTEECFNVQESSKENIHHSSVNKHVWVLTSLMVLLIILVLLGMFLLFYRSSFGSGDQKETALTEDSLESSTSIQLDTTNAESLSETSQIPETQLAPTASILCSDSVINDIPLKFYSPQGGRVELSMGRLDVSDTTVLFAVQAADIRADVVAPVGAFVCKGELVSKGCSKLGFCSIINNEITIGRSKETPEFERAIDSGGGFFRHYSLVCNEKLIEIPVKGKAIRRALCILNDAVTVVECLDRESYHDFAQALVDIGCKEAIALVGGEALLFLPDENGEGLATPNKVSVIQNKAENYIVWRRY